MTTAAVQTATRFVVAELQPGGYTLRAFENQEQFKIWRKLNPMQQIVNRPSAHGRQYDYQDHSFDWQLQ